MEHPNIFFFVDYEVFVDWFWKASDEDGRRLILMLRAVLLNHTLSIASRQDKLKTYQQYDFIDHKDRV